MAIIKNELESRHRIICVDLDGVILSYIKGWCGDNRYGKPVRGALEGMRKLVLDGWWVVIYTCRGDRNKIGSILANYGFQRGRHYHSINRRKNTISGTYPGKIGADLYLDDRAVTFDGDWVKAFKRVKKFQPWESVKK